MTCLGSTLSVRIIDEVAARNEKASVGLDRLCGNVLKRDGNRLDTKLIHQAMVLPTHLYVCETWIVDQRHA